MSQQFAQRIQLLIKLHLMSDTLGPVIAYVIEAVKENPLFLSLLKLKVQLCRILGGSIGRTGT